MSQNKLKVIINADDLGISLDVNAQIEKCIREGLVSSSSLIVNAPFFNEGVTIAKHYPSVSIGIHLNLIEFAPLTNLAIFKEYGIVDDNGSFVDGAIFHASIDDRLKQAIFEEWDAQICKFKDSGLIPSHIDSHQHTHTILPLQDVLCRLMDKHQICKVRRKMVPSVRVMFHERKHPTVILDKSKSIVSPRKSILARRIRLFVVIYRSKKWNRQMKSRYKITDEFLALRYFRFFIEKGFPMKSGTVELMCHPGHVSYQAETESMANVLSMVKEDIEIISYNAL